MTNLHSAPSNDANDANDAIDAACSVYCNSTLLQAVQMRQIFNDSKTFVDMPMLSDPSVVLTSFRALIDTAGGEVQNVTNSQLLDFVNTNFAAAGSDFDPWTPTDWNPSPALIAAVQQANTSEAAVYAPWAASLNSLWLSLGRKLAPDVAVSPQRHSYIPMLYPTIVPGGRFRESYYWDSFFIVQGLLSCDMHLTALNLIRNLLSDVETFGFVPNGGRIYYLDRSQPPMLACMIDRYQQYIEDASPALSSDIDGTGLTLMQFLNNTAFPLLKREHDWWMDPVTGHTVNVNATTTDASSPAQQQQYTLNRYYSHAAIPRPESYYEDVESAQPLEECEEGDEIGCQAYFYRAIRAGAESGWDFSSRWGVQSKNTSQIATSEVVPVDLNSIMYKQETILSSLALYLGNVGDSERYSRLARNRKDAMYSILYVPDEHKWQDYNSSSSSSALSVGITSISSWFPLWAGLVSNDSLHTLYNCTTTDFVDALLSSSLVQVGGVATTLQNTGQQWDYPNAWPPLVYFTIEGLRNVAKLDVDSSDSDFPRTSLAQEVADNITSACLLYICPCLCPCRSHSLTLTPHPPHYTQVLGCRRTTLPSRPLGTCTKSTTASSWEKGVVVGSMCLK